MWLPVAAAVAQTAPPPPDVAISSVGVQTWTSSALAETDVDLAVAQRVRWTLGGDPAGVKATRLLVDARFTIDPGPSFLFVPETPIEGDPLVEWSSVRQLGVEVASSKSVISLGRSAVGVGGPRLVDGVQALVRPSSRVEVGAWAGLQPDPFTTRPVLRPGAGPIVSYRTTRVQASLVGDVSVSLAPEGSGFERAGTLAMLRLASERLIEGSVRVDAELAGPQGPRLVDGTAIAVFTPIEALRFDALYNAFSSYLYQSTATLDPDLQRFQQRLGLLQQAAGITQDTLDPRLNHLVGGTIQLQPPSDGATPRIRATVRRRFHPDPENQFLRLNPQVGVVNVGGALDLLLDGNLIQVDEGTQLDGGLVAVWMPGAVGLDGSFRAVRAPDDLAAMGWYGDLYLDVVSEDLDLLLTAGGSATSEPDVDQSDLGFGAYLRVSKFLRRK